MTPITLLLIFEMHDGSLIVYLQLMQPVAEQQGTQNSTLHIHKVPSYFSSCMYYHPTLVSTNFSSTCLNGLLQWYHFDICIIPQLSTLIHTLVYCEY